MFENSVRSKNYFTKTAHFQHSIDYSGLFTQMKRFKANFVPNYGDSNTSTKKLMKDHNDNKNTKPITNM